MKTTPIIPPFAHGIAFLCVLLSVPLSADAKPPAVDKPVVVIGGIENESTVEDSKFMKSFRTRIESAIANTGKFTVSDRSAMREHEQEMDLVEMGIADGRGAPKDGNVRSIGYKVTGSILMFQFSPGRSADMQVSLKITDIDKQAVSDQKGGIQEVSVHYVPEGLGANVADSVLLNGVLSECAQKIAVRVLEYAFPPKILAVGAEDITVNIRDVQTEIGDLFDVCSVGEELFDPDTGESLGADEASIGRVRVSRPGPKFSKAVPVKGTRLDRLEKGMILRRVDSKQLEVERDRREVGL